jgi:hypothetical protein
LDVLSHGPDSSIPHRYVRVRGNVVVGLIVFAILIGNGGRDLNPRRRPEFEPLST